MNGNVIKARAARLREAGGAQQVDRHLAAQIGKSHRILMENPRMGRTEQFAEVRFDSDQPEGGQIVDACVKGILDGQLTV